MATGPLVFIHPAIEEDNTGQRPSRPSKSEGVVLRRVDNDFFYWNTSTTSSQSKQPQQQATAFSTWDLSADQLLDADWTNSARGHSDPSLQKNPSARFSTELTFDNCLCTSSADSSSAVDPPSCSPTLTSTGTAPMVTPGSDWIIPWQQHSHTQGLNNEEDFFNTQTFHNYAGLGSNATTIVNNRGGFFQTSQPPPPAPLPQPPTVKPTSLATRVNTGSPFEKEKAFSSQQVLGKTQGGVEVPPSTKSCFPGGNGSPSSSTGGRLTAANSVHSAMVFSKHSGLISPLKRRSSTTECANKPVRPSSDTNVISLTDNPGAPMLKMDTTLSLDTDTRTRPCCFCWCCCCSCSCVRVRPPIDTSKRSTHSSDEPHRTEVQRPEPRTTYEEVLSWSESFDNLMRCFTSPNGTVGQKAFREFLRSEYSEENILFWLACEDLKTDTDPGAVEEKAQLIYEDYISILSPKEVSLDSRVREIINTNMTHPTPHTFDEAQLQIYTLMQRDSYPRFLNSRIYKDLLVMTRGDN